jgi:hypothetical protein
MNPNIAALRIAEQRLRYWQEQLQIAYRTDNDEQASKCQLVIQEYKVFTDQAIQQIRSQAVAFLGIDKIHAGSSGHL